MTVPDTHGVHPHGGFNPARAARFVVAWATRC